MLWARDDGLYNYGLRAPDFGCTSVGPRDKNGGEDEVHPSHDVRKGHLIESFKYGHDVVGGIRRLR